MSRSRESLIAKLIKYLRQAFSSASTVSLPAEPPFVPLQGSTVQMSIDRSAGARDQEHDNPSQDLTSQISDRVLPSSELGFPTFEERESTRLIREEEERQRQLSIEQAQQARDKERNAKKLVKEAQEDELKAFRQSLYANLRRVLTDYATSLGGFPEDVTFSLEDAHSSKSSLYDYPYEELWVASIPNKMRIEVTIVIHVQTDLFRLEVVGPKEEQLLGEILHRETGVAVWYFSPDIRDPNRKEPPAHAYPQLSQDYDVQTPQERKNIFRRKRRELALTGLAPQLEDKIRNALEGYADEHGLPEISLEQYGELTPVMAHNARHTNKEPKMGWEITWFVNGTMELCYVSMDDSASYMSLNSIDIPLAKALGERIHEATKRSLSVIDDNTGRACAVLTYATELR